MRDNLHKYFNFAANALSGNLAGADVYLRENRDSIYSAWRHILASMRRHNEPLEREIYRGILLHDDGLKNIAADEREFLSFSGKKDIALHFADPSPEGFGQGGNIIMHGTEVYTQSEWTRRLGSHGYVIRIFPNYERDVIFHWRLLQILPFKDALGEEGVRDLLDQREIIVLPRRRTFPLIRREDLLRG